MRRRVIIVTDRDFSSTAKGNRQRIISLAEGLQEIGCRVGLVCSGRHVPRLSGGPWDEVAIVEAPTYQGGWIGRFDPSPFYEPVRSLCERMRAEAVIAQYAWMAPCLAHTPDSCLRVVDTHDLLFERTTRFEQRGLSPWVRCTEEEELRLLRHADVAIAIQEREAGELRSRLPAGLRVACVPHAVRLPPVYEYRPSAGATVAFVGSKHHGNLGIREFVLDGWPAVREARPDAELRVYGAVCDWLDERDGCRLFGIVDDLSAAYGDATLVVCPIVAGTGLKIKLLEALRHGRAVLATPQAVEGMPRPRAEAWKVATGWSDFAARTVELISKPDHRHRMEREGQRYSLGHYSERHLAGALREILARAEDRCAPQPRPLQATL